jgi:hypothetical protein
MRLLLASLISLLAIQAPPERDPAVLFKQGVTFEQFLADANSQKTLWQTNSGRELTQPEFVTRLKAVSEGLQILVIAEAACSDSVNVVPYLAKAASQAGIELRIVNKATGLAVAEAHLTPDGRSATPTVVLLRNGKEAGAWIERPVVLRTWMLAMEGKIPAAERLSRKMSWYEWDRGDSSLGEIVALAEIRH